jgi:hypothetical protein
MVQTRGSKAKKNKLNLLNPTVDKVVHGARFTVKVAHLHITHSLKIPNMNL